MRCLRWACRCGVVMVRRDLDGSMLRCVSCGRHLEFEAAPTFVCPECLPECGYRTAVEPVREGVRDGVAVLSVLARG